MNWKSLFSPHNIRILMEFCSSECVKYIIVLPCFVRENGRTNEKKTGILQLQRGLK